MKEPLTKKLLVGIFKRIDKKREYLVFVVKRRIWLRNLILTVFAMLAMSAIAGAWYMYSYSGCLWNIGCLVDDYGKPLDIEKLGRSEFKKASYVYAKNGEETGKYFDEIRDSVRIDNIPKLIQNAFLAAEDKRFYDHPGIDATAIASAAVGNTLRKYGIKIWRRSGGASTITQQVARTLYAEEVADFRNRTPTLGRKIREARLAIRLEKRYSKKQILEVFLNLMWLGHGANGVGAADSRYWGKDIRKDLPTISEAVIMAALNKNPAVYDPIFHRPEEPKVTKDTAEEDIAKLKEKYGEKLTKEVVRLAIAKDRYNFVLEQMRDMGAITTEDYEKNVFKKDKNPETEELARLRPWQNYTFGYGNRIVKEFLLSQGKTEKEISNSGGLRIYTTIDPQIQRIASEEFEKHLTLLNQEKSANDKIEGAFIVIDIKSGEILASAGGSNFSVTPFNRVFATRSPGSGFKPFTYAAALESGKDYFDKVCNCPFSMRGANGKVWAPKNFRDKNPQPTGYLDLSKGLIWSLNLETLNLARSIGMESVIKTANEMGVWGNSGIIRDSNGDIWFKKPGYEIRGGLEPTLPTAIGASGVNLIELANAYAVFYRKGVYIHPTLIKEIRGAYGELLFKADEPKPNQVISEQTASKMVGLMRAVTKIGTAKISMRNIEQQVACKTGTSNGPKDISIWCGTPEIFIGIRLGHDDFDKVVELPQYMQKVSGDPKMLPSGGWIVGPMARKIIDRIYANRSKASFSPEVEENLKILLERYQN